MNFIKLQKKALEDVAKWNRERPVGQWVQLRLDDGTTRRTKTYAPAEVIGMTAVGWFVGIRGAYLLSRATPVSDAQSTESDFANTL